MLSAQAQTQMHKEHGEISGLAEAAAHRITSYFFTSCPLLLCCCELRGMRRTSMYTIACMAGTQVVLFRCGVGAFLILTYLEETDLNCGSRAN